MDPKSAVDIAQQGIQLALIVSLPLLCVTLFIGLAVSIFQAVTQVHEMTLTFVPKLLGVGFVMLLSANWLMRTLMEFTVAMVQRIPEVTR